MIKQLMTYGLLSVAAVTAVVAPAQAAETKSISIGGTGMPNFVPQPDGTFVIVAPLTGSVSVASGTVLATRETPTGLEMDMEHYFMTDKGGFIHTVDIGILTAVPGKKGRYMIEITYDVQKEKSSGELTGFDGTFHSYGLVDLNKLQGLIRYSGEITK